MPGIEGVAPGAPQALPVTPGKAAPGGEPLVLKPGDLVVGRLVDLSGKGEGSLEVDGRILRALFPEGLPTGEPLSLRVVGVGPPLVLQVPDAGEEVLRQQLRPPAVGLEAAVQALLSTETAEGLGNPERALLAEIRSLVGLPAPSSASLAPALARLLPRSGIFHEALLAAGQDPQDVKALALRLLGRLPEGPLSRALESLVGHLEAHQARGVLEGMPVIPFVLPWGKDDARGEIWVEERPAGRGAAGASGCLRLRLALPHLGAVEARVRWGAVGTSVRLEVMPEAFDAVSRRLSELADGLVRSAGVRLVDLRADVLTQPSARSGSGALEVLA